jgi:hypothetical protein
MFGVLVCSAYVVVSLYFFETCSMHSNAFEIIVQNSFTGTIRTGNFFFFLQRLIFIGECFYGSRTILRDHVFLNVDNVARNREKSFGSLKFLSLH